MYIYIYIYIHTHIRLGPHHDASSSTQAMPEANRNATENTCSQVCTQFTCFTSTKVQILTPEVLPGKSEVYFALLVQNQKYWYKGTNTDASTHLAGAATKHAVVQ